MQDLIVQSRAFGFDLNEMESPGMMLSNRGSSDLCFNRIILATGLRRVFRKAQAEAGTTECKFSPGRECFPV